ncbi:MAG TPA: 1,2-phenylacetyl-CoA epoxidase subunit PaaD [Nakamurella sp.]|nr:1,2-phenylacetyl-CoA epoxidase subunit PaaD [Nakamurella sp.]
MATGQGSRAAGAVAERIRVHGPDGARAARVAGAVVDPELPMLTIADLGVLRSVTVRPDHDVHVTITPTYSGCPAVQAISADIDSALRAAGYRSVTVETVLAPAWSSDDITPEGRDALRRAGIAPPAHQTAGPVPLQLSVRCPQCGSRRTEQLSRFGSTSCKALYRCRDCAEPFDYVKVL